MVFALRIRPTGAAPAADLTAALAFEATNTNGFIRFISDHGACAATDTPPGPIKVQLLSPPALDTHIFSFALN